MVFSRLWQPFQTSDTITQKIEKGHSAVTTSAEDHYEALNTWRYRHKNARQSSKDLTVVSEKRYRDELCIDE
ncbi:hypothetical protein TNCT_692201 [Trichonephila clavata]|uniref:Uncharacterized protein n=1 Tax=Trichonephila clavata TaxID=2740835 RepID=A0A8X6G201_TRICU|nr:hypothetical protein TNCT_692201 [Trichonephila clavata]